MVARAIASAKNARAELRWSQGRRAQSWVAAPRPKSEACVRTLEQVVICGAPQSYAVGSLYQGGLGVAGDAHFSWVAGFFDMGRPSWPKKQAVKVLPLCWGRHCAPSHPPTQAIRVSPLAGKPETSAAVPYSSLINILLLLERRTGANATLSVPPWLMQR